MSEILDHSLSCLNDKEDLAETESGKSLAEICSRGDPGIDKTTLQVLEQVLHTNPLLNNMRILLTSPEDESDTGGYFCHIKIDKEVLVPAVTIVKNDEKHFRELMKKREFAVRWMADLLNISYDEITPDILRTFIILHELGHAKDFVVNYESNPDYQGQKLDDVWEDHYENCLMSLPVPGLDPVDLRQEIKFFSNLDDFIKKHPEIHGRVNQDEIKSFEDLLELQEKAYRKSPYESYADKFAVNIIMENGILNW